MEKEIIYFELNNWFSGQDYPNEEPFFTWMKNTNLYFQNKEWDKENKLCVVVSYIDMSVNFCITATKEWIMKNCPKLLTDYTKFIRTKEEHDDIIGRFGTHFLEYNENNIGLFYDEDNDL